MQTHLTLTLSTFLLCLTFTISPTFFSCATGSSNYKPVDKPQDLVHSSCIHARYPRLCLRTLSNYAGPVNTRLDVAQAALRVSLAHARRVSKYFKTLRAAPGSFGQQSPTSKSGGSLMNKRQRVALRDCTEQMADAVDELRKSLEELQHLRPETFRWQMSDAQTWVSAALSNGDSCLEGFGGGGDGDDDNGEVKRDVKRRVNDVARVTSNALYMINRLGDGGVGKVKGKHRSGRGSGSKN